jgi:hypothetical protein
MTTEHWNTKKVEQNDFDYSDGCSLIYSDGLGPCIGVCIAWRKHAWILHSANICFDVDDVILPKLKHVKRIVPEDLIKSIQPVVCGGDIYTDDLPATEADELVADIMRCRQLIIDLLKQEGFGEPIVRWNNIGQTTSISADLNRMVVVIEDGIDLLTHSIPR